ncbi:MAG: hypothetical protein CEE40_12155 [Chloroflexi bacterium B3_Chlor]|nr:MAG: hypothetical protein CEE40_12155 [Chloroflexi bacterium B3_Chlor]
MQLMSQLNQSQESFVAVGQQGENGAEPDGAYFRTSCQLSRQGVYDRLSRLSNMLCWDVFLYGRIERLGDDVRLRLSVGHGAGVHEVGDNVDRCAGFRDGGLFRESRRVGGVWSAEGISADSY